MSYELPTLIVPADYKYAPAAARAVGAKLRALGQAKLAEAAFQIAADMTEWQRKHPDQVEKE